MALDRVPEDRPQLTPLLEERWSPRAFDPGHVLAGDELALLFEAARWAPSAGNSQPWSFIYGLRGDETHAKIFSLLADGNQRWAKRASAIIITIRQLAAGPDHDLFGPDHTQFDLGQSVAHLSIQAGAMGLHVHQFSGFDRPGTALAFGVPDHWEVTSGIAIGRIAAPDVFDEQWEVDRELKPRDRRPVSEFVFPGRWGQAR
jgi:nitroreductase